MVSKRLSLVVATVLASILAFIPVHVIFAQDGLSENIFPETLEELPLQGIEELSIEDWEREEWGLEQVYIAYYEYGEEQIIVQVAFLEDGKKTASYMEENWVSATKEGWSEELDVEFGPTSSTSVEGYSGEYFRITYMSLTMLQLAVAASNYLVAVISFQDNFFEAERVASYFIEKLVPVTKPETEKEEEPVPTEKEPALAEVTPARASERAALLDKIDEAEEATLAAVWGHTQSYFQEAAKSKAAFAFLVGRLLEKHDLDLRYLKELLGPERYEQLDFAYDLDKIDSLRRYCREEKGFGEFSREYQQYAERRVRVEFAFDEARSRIEKGSEELRTRINKGEMDKVLNMLGGLADEFSRGMEKERMNHYESMVYSRQAAGTIGESIGIIDKLTGYASKLFGGQLGIAKIASELSLVWAQNEVRYWTTFAYLWGGTEEMKENDLERLRQQFDLFEREEFHYGPVFAVEEGIEELVEEWR